MAAASFQKRYLVTGLILGIGLIILVPLVKLFQGAVTPPEAQGLKVRGPIKAPVWIQEFSDFQCPACGNAPKVVEDIFKRYPGKIRQYYYHFPLAMHKWATLAHRSAECAAEQDKFWPFHDVLFERQKVWSNLQDPKPAFHQYAREIGLDENRFTACFDQGQTPDVILKDIEKGKSLQVRSTPTFFVNGKQVIGGKLFAQEIEKVIKEELGK
jgi:protein-disulfide isomerase